MDNKEKLLPQLLQYAGGKKILTYLSMVISGISQLLALAPFLYIWAIIRDVIAGDYGRIAANMRKVLMRHIMTLPIGFLDSLGSGKVRKWVQDSTQSTETYLAHQLPDKAGMYATMLDGIIRQLNDNHQ